MPPASFAQLAVKSPLSESLFRVRSDLAGARSRRILLVHGGSLSLRDAVRYYGLRDFFVDSLGVSDSLPGPHQSLGGY